MNLGLILHQRYTRDKHSLGNKQGLFKPKGSNGVGDFSQILSKQKHRSMPWNKKSEESEKNQRETS
jgi:hypothetical protein